MGCATEAETKAPAPSSREARATAELGLPDAAMRQRELLAKPGEPLALALVVIECGALTGGQRGGRGDLRCPQRLDPRAQRGMLAEKRAADPCTAGDRRERDRGAPCIELAQCCAHALLGIRGALGGRVE